MNKLTKGFTLVELLVVIGILGILMGALFPAISAAMLSANTSAMSMRGRNLFVGITQANTEREGQGLMSVWPKNNDQINTDDPDDIAGKPFSDSAKYFEELFNIAKYGDPDWSPYVNGVDLGVLSGSGVQSFTGGKTLSGDCVAWMVLLGVADEMEDIVPVLITRNVNKSLMDQQVTAATHESATVKTEVKIGKDNGAESNTPFGNKAWIAIRKGGAATVIKAKYSKVYLIFNRQSYNITGTCEYLLTGGK